MPEYELPKGSFSVKTSSVNETVIINIESVLLSNQLNITKKYKIGTADLPEKLELEGKTYDLLRIRQAPINLKMDSEPGNITAKLIFSVLYEEIVNVDGEEV